MTKVFFGVTVLLLTGALFFFSTGTRADGMPAVMINELMWMGSSSSSSDEWIELKNTTNQPIDLTGWFLTKLSSGVEAPMLTIPSGTIPADGFFLIANFSSEDSRLSVVPDLVESDVSLVNSKLQLSLYTAQSALVDRADDGSGNPLSGEYASGARWKSMERSMAGFDGMLPESWHTTSVSSGFDDQTLEYGTPKSENSNLSPVPVLTAPETGNVGEVLTFDASASTDPEHDTLVFTWSFGDGAVAEGATPTHRYEFSGQYTIRVTVSDGRTEAKLDQQISITATTPTQTVPPQQTNSSTTPQTQPGVASPTTTMPTPETFDTYGDILVNEVLPNPNGRDADGEYIELVNAGSSTVNLNGWQLTDTRTYFRFSSDIILDAGEITTVPRSISGVSLNNDEDILYVLDPSGVVRNGVRYSGSREGLAFAHHPSGDWRWTEPTPQGENTFLSITDDEEEEETSETTQQAQGNNVERPSNEFRLASMQDLSTLEIGEKVEVTGVVSVPAGIFGDRVFFLMNKNAGTRVDLGSAAFLTLEEGESVRVRGKVSQVSGERKIHVSKVEDVDRLGVDEPAIAEFSSTLASGTLTVFEGVVSEKRGTTISVETESGIQTVSLSKASGLSSSDFESGKTVRVLGIWRVREGTGKLYPRSQDDLEPQGEVAAATVEEETKESNSGASISVQSSDQPSSALGIGVPIVLAVASIGGYFWYRRKKSS